MAALTTKQVEAVTKDLVEFVHRVATNENASPAEIAALPEVAKVLLGNRWFSYD